ncbi:MAG: hypothetical protein IME99_02660 [Proteobacteria bacterium]|nr:hypothetical protein [Pseudomonadota bacterium]
MQTLYMLPMIMASIALVLATSSFISGLQLIKGKRASVNGIIHRINGYCSVTLLFSIAVLSFILHGFSGWALFGWLCALGLIALKIWIVRRRARRAFKYVSWIGATMILIWLYVLITNIPL